MPSKLIDAIGLLYGLKTGLKLTFIRSSFKFRNDPHQEVIRTSLFKQKLNTVHAHAAFYIHRVPIQYSILHSVLLGGGGGWLGTGPMFGSWTFLRSAGMQAH